MVPSSDTGFSVRPERDSTRTGRAPVTSRGEIGRIALMIFLDRGFDETTIDEIAEAAGIGRRTFFRYYASKNDLPWGDFEELLQRMRGHLSASLVDEEPIMDSLRQAVIEFNRFPEAELPLHRERMRLLFHVPSLVAHSALRYAEWRQVIAEFVAARTGRRAEELQPQAIARTCLGLCLAAYDCWLAEEDSDLLELLSSAFLRLGEAFGGDLR